MFAKCYIHLFSWYQQSRQIFYQPCIEILGDDVLLVTTLIIENIFSYTLKYKNNNSHPSRQLFKNIIKIYTLEEVLSELYVLLYS